jgi:hypothetical protein
MWDKSRGRRSYTELLELGRGVMWSQLLETRTDILVLREACPDLAARLVVVRHALDELDAPTAKE